LANSAGFTQLGVLIAIGILVAGLCMTSIFLLFTRAKTPPQRSDWVLAVVRNYVRRMLRTPTQILWVALPVLLVLLVLAFLPQLPLVFDFSAHSMEPRSSAAARALAAIMEKMPVRWEPVLGILRSPNEESLHQSWQTIDAHWREVQRAGRIKSFSTPAALALSPQLMGANRARLQAIDFSAARQGLSQAIANEGFRKEGFAAGFQLLDELEAVARGTKAIPDWRKELPPSSSWWFLVDRYFSHDPLLTVGFVTTNHPLETHAQ